MTARVWLGAVVAAVLAGPAAADPPAGKIDGEAVKKAWAARQDRAKSFAFEWTDTVTIPRGRTSRNRPPDGPEVKGDVPPHDLVHVSPRSLFLDGDKARFRYTAQHWWPSLNGPITEECDSSFDAGKYTSSASYTPAGATVPTGTVKRAKAHPDLSTLSARPVMVALRGTAKEYAIYDPAAYEPTGRTVPVNGVRCAELVRENRAQAWRSVLLVDAARDFVLVRATRHERDKLTYQFDVTYAADAAAGWVPASWDHVYFDPTGAVYASGRCKATRREVNAALEAEALACTPPPGTRMVDVTGPVQVQYVVQPDGGAGKKFPRSSDVTYADLVAAGPDDSGRWWARGPWLACAAAFAGSLGLLGWRTVSRARRRGAAA